MLIVDIGDHVDRMNVKTEASWGHTNVQVLNKSGYQYATIGNNEGLTLPKEKLDELYDQADFTVVLSNLIEPSTGQQPKWAVPYVIRDWGNLRVAILGVTIVFSPTYEMMGWQTREPLRFLQEQVETLRSEVDVVIVLSHLGYSFDVRLAREIPGIDVILGGHTHHLLEHGERVGSTLIAQTGRFGDYVGHICLSYDPVEKKVHSQAEVFAINEFLPDPELHVFIQQQEEAAQRSLAQPVARLYEDLEIDWTRETTFGSLLAASVRRLTGAEIALANGGLLLTPLLRGEVTRKDLLQCVPHPISCCAVTLNGSQLLRLLERVIQPEIVRQELRGFGFRGKMMGWMGVDGVTIAYRLEPVPQIFAVTINEEPLDYEREYRVGTVDMFLFNRLFPELLEGRDPYFFQPRMLRELLADTLSDTSLITDCLNPRWQLLLSPFGA